MLQVRWITAVNVAQEQQLRAELEGAARRFSEDVDRELLAAITSFKTRQGEEVLDRYPKLWPRFEPLPILRCGPALMPTPLRW